MEKEAEKAIGSVILFGPPGAGKGTQAQQIAKRYGVPVVATGDILRAEIEAGSEIGRKAKEILAAGHLVADEVVNELVEERLGRADCRRGFLLDGYPRTEAQAEWLEELLTRLGHKPVVIEIQIGYNEIVQRITGRRLCPNCGTIYHIHSHPPKVPDVCDVCQTPLVVRPDDREDVLEERLEAYERQTLPVFEVFRAKGRTIHSVDGALPPEEVAQRIFEILKQA